MSHIPYGGTAKRFKRLVRYLDKLEWKLRKSGRSDGMLRLPDLNGRTHDSRRER